jgi:hypothetical protein
VVAMGRHFRNTALEDSAAAIYLEGDIAMEGKNSSELNDYYLNVQYFVWGCIEFLLALWIVKDHPITLLPAVLKISPSDERPKYQIFTFGHRNFNATGSSDKPVEFSREEIRIAAEYYQDWIVKFTRKSANEIIPEKVFSAQTSFDKNSKRLFRFLWILEYARTGADIGIKLGLFCSCLECLFSDNDTSNITHKIAAKTAFFLEGITPQGGEIYKQIKGAYNLRSRVFHGGTIENRGMRQLEQVCVQTDDLLRKVFVKILKSKSTELDFFKMFIAEENQLREFLSDALSRADVFRQKNKSMSGD